MDDVEEVNGDDDGRGNDDGHCTSGKGGGG